MKFSSLTVSEAHKRSRRRKYDTLVTQIESELAALPLGRVLTLEFETAAESTRVCAALAQRIHRGHMQAERVTLDDTRVIVWPLNHSA